jgi:hypothetical protein
MGTERKQPMDSKDTKPKKILNLTVKTLEKKAAPRMAKKNGATPVIGYS